MGHSSCMNYVAHNEYDSMCKDIDICRDCTGPAPDAGKDGLENCKAVKSTRYYVSEFWYSDGAHQMKNDIAKGGPISCGIMATEAFDKYDGKGIYEEEIKGYIHINHIISVVGYGKTDKGQEYWIGRNSWGTYWGDYGFFYMNMYKNNLRIEQDCIAGIPTYDKPNSADET